VPDSASGARKRRCSLLGLTPGAIVPALLQPDFHAAVVEPFNREANFRFSVSAPSPDRSNRDRPNQDSDGNPQDRAQINSSFNAGKRCPQGISGILVDSSRRIKGQAATTSRTVAACGLANRNSRVVRPS
jgi:hypothetical protein